MAILDDFQQWLKGRGYKEYSDAGNKSTIFDYTNRIKKVSVDENCSVEELAKNIDVVVAKYDQGGEKEEVGKNSHSSVIEALKRFKECLNDQK